jgi:SSS family solute:Na+ symporter
MMTASVVALSVIFIVVALGTIIGLYAGSHYKMDLEQWAVAGRGFGLILVWMLMAGEVYTTFSLLGASGWAYSRGGPTLYIIAYITLAYVGGFYFLPQMWEVGKKHSMQTESDFFQYRYGSKYLTSFVSFLGVAFIIPYLQLQITGLGIIVEVGSFGAISRTVAMMIGVAIVAAFVLVSGIRAVAWVSILKDALMVFAALFIGIGIPRIYFGGIGPMFTALEHAEPRHLMMPGATPNMGHGWYISTVLLTSLGFYMWPHLFGAAFTAKSSDTLRRNAVIMPLYTMTLPLVFFVGFAAVLIVPGLTNGDLSLLTIVRKTFPPWFLGLIGGTGALTAMVPAAMLILTAATMFAKNFYRPIFSPAMSDEKVSRLAKTMVFVITGITLFFALHSSSTLVSLLLLGYAGVAQFFPGIVLGLYWSRVTLAGVFSGIIVGITVVAVMTLGKRDPFMGLNVGFLALCLNFLIAAVVSLFTTAQQARPVSAEIDE